MLSEAAEFLIAALAPLHQGICVDCGARVLERSREESLKATKELIANGYALAGLDACALCDEVKLVTRLRLPPSYHMNSGDETRHARTETPGGQPDYWRLGRRHVLSRDDPPREWRAARRWCARSEP
jgi:hypothetical protein